MSVKEPDPLAGRARLAVGREAEVFEWGEGRVLRLARSAAWAPGVAIGGAASEAARRAGVRTPRVLETVEIDGRPGQVLERVDGRDLLARLAANPLRLPTVARRLAEVHLELHRVIAPDELPSTHEAIGPRLRRSPAVPSEVRDQVLDVLDGLPQGDRICHGDFHPGNLLEASTGPTLIDWTNASRGDPIADFARTRLTLQMGEVPPDSPLVIRLLSGAGRGALWRWYDRVYRRGSGPDDAMVHRWTLVAAASRLTDEIESERPKLLDFLSTAFPQR